MDKPNFKLERLALKKGYELVIGVDEVGRGALAGPVVAGAVAISNLPLGLTRGKQFSNWETLGIDDSKKLTVKKREELAKIIKRNAFWGIGEVGVVTINKIGIVKATEKAMRIAVAKINQRKAFVLIDAFHVKYIPGVGLSNQKAIVRGDQKALSIAAASIIAKVHRDKILYRLYKNYKHYKCYKWNKNKGYGTADHIKAVKKHGVTRHHRLAFVKNII